MIKSKIDTRTYIGSSINVKHRIESHLSLLKNNKHFNRHLQSFYNKYGIKSLNFELLITCPKEYLIKMEQWFIDNLKPKFNIRTKAESRLGVKCSDEFKRNVGIRSSILYKGEGNPFYGKTHNEETLEKMRNAYKHTKITIKDIENIKIRVNNKENQRIIAQTYNITRETVNRIATGKYKRRDI
jgi:group I intron endonuclease